MSDPIETIRTKALQVIARELPDVRVRASLSQTRQAFLAMYAGVLKALCRATSVDDDYGRIRVELPSIAADVLLDELVACGECPELEMGEYERAGALLARKRAAPVFADALLTGVNEFCVNLSLGLDQVASTMLLRWRAEPDRAGGVPLDCLISGLAHRRRFTRIEEFEQVRRVLQRGGVRLTVANLLRRARVSRRFWYEHWLKELVPDDAPAAERIGRIYRELVSQAETHKQELWDK